MRDRINTKTNANGIYLERKKIKLWTIMYSHAIVMRMTLRKHKHKWHEHTHKRQHPKCKIVDSTRKALCDFYMELDIDFIFIFIEKYCLWSCNGAHSQFRVLIS